MQKIREGDKKQLSIAKTSIGFYHGGRDYFIGVR